VGKVLPGLSGEQFDIILADPPYERGLDTETLSLVARYNLLEGTGVVVLEHSRRDRPVMPDTLKSIKTHRYGDTVVSIIRCNNTERNDE
jgi:16S rRNA (guanine966-N2)-methyltransferase